MRGERVLVYKEPMSFSQEIVRAAWDRSGAVANVRTTVTATGSDAVIHFSGQCGDPMRLLEAGRSAGALSGGRTSWQTA